MNEVTSTDVSRPRGSEPFDRWYRKAVDQVTSSLHQAIATAGLSTPVEEFIDDKGHLVVRMDMPGMSPDDIEAKVRQGQLIIEGRRRHHDNGPQENILRSEVMYGRFRRSLPLPSWVNNGDVGLSYEDGVLELQLETDAKTCPHTTVFKPKRVMRQARQNSGSQKAEAAKQTVASA